MIENLLEKMQNSETFYEGEHAKIFVSNDFVGFLLYDDIISSFAYMSGDINEIGGTDIIKITVTMDISFQIKLNMEEIMKHINKLKWNDDMVRDVIVVLTNGSIDSNDTLIEYLEKLEELE